MGIKTVGIYSSADIGLPHTYSMDEMIYLGEGSLQETYLNADLIVHKAFELGVDAIHPGYGFLSENSAFASLVREKNMIFLGPSPKVIDIMGDKKASKETLFAIATPLIPGYFGDKQDSKTLLEEAKKIGFPVLIKATAGGGGKGMRVVESENEFVSSLESAMREAKKSFGIDTVMLEKYILSPRHIEVQVLSDQHGNHRHLFERECSIQRRHQKIVEETPSTALDPELRKKICDTAVAIASHVKYEGAGTVEFILDTSGAFYFLEMNTRLQVEHPITEMLTGVDLVKWQIKIGEGKIISFSQDDLVPRGHAIEVRIYAEDPDNEFLPTNGVIERVGTTHLNGVRLDTGYADGSSVGVEFDPMLAKLIAHSDTRRSAITKLLLALDEITFSGLKTNRDHLKRILNSLKFKEGETYTDFIDKNGDSLGVPEVSNDSFALGIAALQLSGKNLVSETGASHICRDSLVLEESLNMFRNV